MTYQYKVVPFIGRITGKQTAVDVAKQLEDTIAHYTGQGWEFQQLSDVNIEVKPGCLAALLGARVTYINFDQIIFRRPVNR